MSKIPGHILTAVTHMLAPHMDASDVRHRLTTDLDQKPAGKWRTVEYVAEHLGVTDWCIRNWIRQGKLKARHFGSALRIHDDDISEIPDSPKNKPKEPNMENFSAAV